MDTFALWGNTLVNSFNELWFKFVDIIPRVVGAIIIFIVGLFVAEGLGRLVAKILAKLYLDKAIEKAGFQKVLERAGFKVQVSKALGLTVTWFLYVVFLIAVTDILGLTQITVFLKTVALYLPNVIIAVVVLAIGIVVADFINKVVREAARAAKVQTAELLAGTAKWAILVFSAMAALTQLRVATELIRILFTGLVFMVALAAGLAFGLGGKEKAADLLKKINKGRE